LKYAWFVRNFENDDPVGRTVHLYNLRKNETECGKKTNNIRWMLSLTKDPDNIICDRCTRKLLKEKKNVQI
jgi:hypothetical protein